MTINEFKDYVKTGNAHDTEDIHMFMDEMSDAARRITFRLNAAYHTQAEVRKLLSELFGCDVPSSLRVFPPFYTDFGKNITIGENVFINACCHFQDHGGVVIGDGCQIGHNVVFATLNHGLSPEERKHTYPAPIVVGKNVWVGSNSTILQGVTIGDNAVVAAGAVVNIETGEHLGRIQEWVMDRYGLYLPAAGFVQYVIPTGEPGSEFILWGISPDSTVSEPNWYVAPNPAK